MVAVGTAPLSAFSCSVISLASLMGELSRSFLARPNASGSSCFIGFVCVLEKLLALVDEALALRRHLLVVQFRELAQQFLLLLGHRPRRLHHDLHLQVASAAVPQALHPLAEQR